MENVSWDDAQEFIKKLNEKEKGKGYQYRLPSEAEWEYACRGGAASSKPFHYGDSLSRAQANFNGNFTSGPAVEGAFWSLRERC